MKIYHYHPDYKIYLGSSDADESPLEPGVFLIPAYATDIEPPTCIECKIPVFNETSWDIIDDCRGVYYNVPTGQEIQHTDPLNPPENATKQQPPEVPEGYVLKWNDGTSWDIIDDCSGTYYSIITQEEIQHTDPLNPPENATKQQPPEVPEGYVLEWNDGWELKELPPPPVLTPAEKLEQAGLTVEELKELLGL